MVDSIIKLENISFSYDEEIGEVLSGINFEIKKGEWIAIVGPNGSGKSTLARIIDCLLIPNEGELTVAGQVASEENVYDIRSHIGMVFQNPDNQFVGSTVEDDVAFGLENAGVERSEMIDRVSDALEQVNMASFKKHEPSRLSGGQKQRVAIAGVVALRPDIIILDEATAMLDPQGRSDVLDLVVKVKDKYNLTVISITHDIDEAARADRLLVMKNGQLLYQLTPEEFFTSQYDLVELGLEYPFAQQVKKSLEEKGIRTEESYQNEKELLMWLKQSYLKI